MKVKISKTENAIHGGGYKTSGSSGFDCSSQIHTVLIPFSRMKIPLGFHIEIPAGFEGQVRGRSGVSLNKGLIVIEGTIDSDYRGEVSAIVVNIGEFPVVINGGDRIAQFVISPVQRVDFEEVPVSALSETNRGSGGFGSTGI